MVRILKTYEAPNKEWIEALMFWKSGAVMQYRIYRKGEEVECNELTTTMEGIRDVRDYLNEILEGIQIMDSVFCTNCGGEFVLHELKFTINKETNSVMGVCPLCNWNEFTKDLEDLSDYPEDYERTKYPEQSFYLEG